MQVQNAIAFFRSIKALVTRLLACPVAANEPTVLVVSWVQTLENCLVEARAASRELPVASQAVPGGWSTTALSGNPIGNIHADLSRTTGI
jgi:hypothetical protein